MSCNFGSDFTRCTFLADGCILFDRMILRIYTRFVCFVGSVIDGWHYGLNIRLNLKALCIHDID